MPGVFQRPRLQQHFAPLCSCASLCCILAIPTVLVVSWAIAFTTNGLWITRKDYQEQPAVTFQHLYMFSALGSDGQEYSYSTFPYYNDALRERLRVPAFQVAPIYTNIDDKADAYHVKVTLPLATGEVVNHIRVATFFRYTTEDNCRVAQQIVAYFDYSSPVAGSRVTAVGDITARQRNAFPWRGSYSTYDTAVINRINPDASSYEWRKWLSTYEARNLTGVFTPTFVTWEPAGTATSFEVDLTLNIPTNTLVYSPGFWETFKFGLVQLAPIAIVVYLIYRALWKFIINNQLAPTKVMRDGEYVKPF